MYRLKHFYNEKDTILWESALPLLLNLELYENIEENGAFTCYQLICHTPYIY